MAIVSVYRDTLLSRALGLLNGLYNGPFEGSADEISRID